MPAPPLKLKRPAGQEGEDTVIVTPLTYERAADLVPLILPILPDLMVVFGTMVARLGPIIMAKENAKREVVDVLKEHAVELVPTLDDISPLVARICAKLPPDQLRFLRRELLTEAVFNGTRLYGEKSNPIDHLLQGRTMAGFQILYYALEVNYPDFFGVLSVSDAAPKAAANPSAA